MAAKNVTVTVTERAIVVCTARRGVFFGYTAEPISGEEIIQRGTIALSRARQCVYWSAETRGVIGLGSIGPQRGSRVGPAAPTLAIDSISAVIDCTDAAVVAWEAGPWQ